MSLKEIKLYCGINCDIGYSVLPKNKNKASWLYKPSTLIQI